MEATHVNQSPRDGATNASPATDAGMRDKVAAMLEAREVTQAEAARQAGVSTTALNRWLNGKYEGDNAAVEAKLARWLDERARQAGFLLPEAPGWVETRTAERIMAALSYGQMAADLVVVYGGAGLGKTETIHHYAEQRPNVWVTRMSPATKSAAAALEEICETAGVNTNYSSGASRMQRALIKKLTSTRGLLVLDEAQHLAVDALETVRAIHDSAGIGLALVGNEQVYSRLTGAGQSALFAQLFSRVGKRLRLTRPYVQDVETLAKAWGISGERELKLLRELGQTPGALRGVVKVIRLGAMYATGAGEALAFAHLQAARKELDSTNGHNR